jgi:hypothetical protein
MLLNLWLKVVKIFFYIHSRPVPPKVNEGRITKGNQILVQFLSSKVRSTYFCRADGTPIFLSNCLNCSVFGNIDSININTYHFKILPNSFSSASRHKFKAVCPPIVGKQHRFEDVLLEFQLSI